MKIIIDVFMLVFAISAILGFSKMFINGYNHNLIKTGLFNNNKLKQFPLYEASQEKYVASINKVNEFLSSAISNTICEISFDSDEINSLVCRGVTFVKPFDLLNENGIVFYYIEGNKIFKKNIYFIPFGGLFCYELEIRLVNAKEIVTSPTKEEREKIEMLKCPIIILEDSVYSDNKSQSSLEKSINQWIQNQESKTKIGSYFYKSSLVLNLFNSDLNYSSEEINDILIKKVNLMEMINNKLFFHANNPLKGGE
jgi:hypothetical protein